ncbi:peptidyl-tRNA hydrolase 2, mitochondrial-like [Planococcus citri]|uniref:peptidyl-tRNA hydrolase 2, mitochondrial-like n=1 Tax=Planococcus citri TaxID=170843 RepID=UPI0031F925CB
MYRVFIAGLTGGAMAGLIFKFFLNKSAKPDAPQPEKKLKDCLTLSDEGPLYKLALVVNNELKMTAGKVLAQCSHAALGVYEKYSTDKMENFLLWELKGKPITVYKVNDSETLIELQKAAKTKNLMTYIVQDAGRTQIASGSRTVLAIGPDESEKLQSIVSYLPLY